MRNGKFAFWCSRHWTVGRCIGRKNNAVIFNWVNSECVQIMWKWLDAWNILVASAIYMANNNFDLALFMDQFHEFHKTQYPLPNCSFRHDEIDWYLVRTKLTASVWIQFNRICNVSFGKFFIIQLTIIYYFKRFNFDFRYSIKQQHKRCKLVYLKPSPFRFEDAKYLLLLSWLCVV